MKRQSWNLHYGNKAIIFTLDAIIALSIVLVILIVSNVYIARSNNEINNLQVLRDGYDVISMLHYYNKIQGLSADEINNELSTLLQGKYDMIIQVRANNQNISIGGEKIPNDRFIGSGKIYSVRTGLNNSTFITTRFWIWLK